MVDWSHKYLPVKTEEIVGQRSAISEVKTFVRSYCPGDKSLLLHGPPGSGKNAIVYAVASELELELIEVNASDKRNADAIRSIVGNASKQASLFKKSKIILVDEVDGLYGVQDRGAVPEMTRTIRSSQFPMILTANDPWSKKFSLLRKHVKMVQLRRLRADGIVSILRRICDAESISYDLMVLKQIAESSKGDARAAINDLQTLSSNRRKITLADTAPLGDREKESTIYETLSAIFRGKSAGPSVFETLRMPLEEAMLWIAENLPYEYRSMRDVADAYDKLSRADVMIGRIRRWQYWRFKYYASILSSLGVSSAKQKPREGWFKYRNPSKILKLWKTKSLRARRRSISEKVAGHCHCSKKVASRYFLVLRAILMGGGEIEGVELTPQEVETLTFS